MIFIKLDGQMTCARCWKDNGEQKLALALLEFTVTITPLGRAVPPSLVIWKVRIGLLQHAACGLGWGSTACPEELDCSLP